MKSVTTVSKTPARRRGAALASAAAGLLLMSAASARAESPQNANKLPTSVVIYHGDTLQSAGVSLSNWGSGTIDEDKSKIFSGTESLRIVTHGMYQGASISLSRPVDLGPYLVNKNNYLSIAVLIPSTNPNGAPAQGGFPGFAGGRSGQGFSGGNSGRSSGGQVPGGPPSGIGGPPGGIGGPPGAFGGRGGQIDTQKNRKVEDIRAVLVTTTGKNFEILLPVANATTQNEWKILAIPLSAIPNLTQDDARIKEFRLFGDAPATINIGSIGITEDPSPITINSINDKTVQRLAKYQYVATANAGITPIVYTWDWDASDGIQDETEGRNVTHVFRKASVDDAGKNNDVVVTVTARDLYNMKPPAKTTFKVHVTP